MITVFSTIFVLGVLIFVHEAGHFLAAKLFHIRVDRFSLGFPPRLIGKKIGETDYCIGVVPLGGYVKIAGMVDESLDKEQLSTEPKPWEYRSKPWLQRVLVVFSGPVMNLFLGFAIFVAGALIYGIVEQVKGPIVGEVVEDTPAQAAGIKAGDRILSIDGAEVILWEEMTEIVRQSAERPLMFQINRRDSVFTVQITPIKTEIEESGEIREIGQVGLYPQFETKRVGLIHAVAIGGESVFDLSSLVLVSIYRLIIREESMESLAGPVLISKMAGESARLGFSVLVGFIAILSVNLGILNLLPIPVLDGGHLLFLTVEGLIRRQIPLKTKLIIQQVGMVLILALMAFVIYQDILRVIQ